MNSHIPTLLQREWMQHKLGWLITAFAPPLIFLAMLPFSHMDGEPNLPTELIALVVLVGSGCVVYSICLLVALFQLPGLARRDAQDRSIEFWLSLPSRPSESVASTVLAHAWLAPLGGAVVGTVFGLLIALTGIGVKFGWGNAFSVHWGEVLSAASPMLLRALVGTVLMTLWLSPLILALMAASAWLKRLGTPLVLVGGGMAVAVLHKAYDIDWPLQALKSLNAQINHALLSDPESLMHALKSDASLWQWLAQDLGTGMTQLASAEFLGWAAVAAAGFALVVMKRARGG